MAKVETVEVNGVIVNKGDEAAAAKWAHRDPAASVAEAEASEEGPAADEKPAKKEKK